MVNKKTIKQHLREMKVGEIKSLWHDDYGVEWFWVERLDSKNWIIESHYDDGSGRETLRETYQYHEMQDRFYVEEKL